MAQLNQTTIATILKKLDEGKFTQYDFEVSFPDKGSLLEIRWKMNPKYYFLLSEEPEPSDNLITAINTKRAYLPTTNEAPGDVRNVERRQHASFDSAFDRIRTWKQNIYQDIKSHNPIAQELDELRRQLDEHIQISENEAESYFTSEEARGVSERLDSVLQKFEKLEAEHKLTKEQLEQLRADLNSIKATTLDLPKGLWTTVTKNRFVVMARRIISSPEGRKFALEAAKRLLLPNNSGS